MNKLFNRKMTAALNLLQVVAMKPGYKTLHSLSLSLDEPYPFVTQIMALLAKHGYVTSSRGRYTQGYAATSKMQEATVFDFAQIFGYTFVSNPLHDSSYAAEKLMQGVLAYMQSTTLSTLIITPENVSTFPGVA